MEDSHIFSSFVYSVRQIMLFQYFCIDTNSITNRQFIMSLHIPLHKTPGICYDIDSSPLENSLYLDIYMLSIKKKTSGTMKQ